MNPELRLVPMERHLAEQVCTWRYQGFLERYSMDHGDPGALAAPGSGVFALLDADAALVGFRSYGLDGQVPGLTYDEGSLDTGGGLRPDRVGTGLGKAAMRCGLDYAGAHLGAPVLRVSIWEGNGVALHVARSVGYVECGRGVSDRGDTFVVFTQPSRAPVL